MGRFDQFLRQRYAGTAQPRVLNTVVPRPAAGQTPATPAGNPMATSALPTPIPTNQMGAQQYVQGRDAYRDRVNLPTLPAPDYAALREPEGVRFAAAIRAQQAREASIARVTTLIPGTDVARLNALPDDKLAEAEQTAVQLAAPSTVGQDRPTVVPPVAPVIAAPTSPPPPGSGYDQASWDALPPETQDFVRREDAKRQLAPDTTPVTTPITAINQASAGSTVTPSPKDLAVQEIQSLDAAIAAAQSRGDTTEVERLRVRRTERTDTLALGGAVTQGPSVSAALDPIMKGTRASVNAVGDTLQATTDALAETVPQAVQRVREDPVQAGKDLLKYDPIASGDVGAAVEAIVPGLNLIDVPRVWSVTEQAEGARQIAYGEDLDLGQEATFQVLMQNPAFRALGLVLEDLSIVDWVKAGGEDRKFNTRWIYENGYTAKNGETFTGDRAVWEWFVGQQNTATRIAIDLLYDPLNVLPVGRSVGLIDDASRGARVVGRTAALADEAINLPFKPIEKAVGNVLSKEGLFGGKVRPGQQVRRGVVRGEGSPVLPDLIPFGTPAFVRNLGELGESALVQRGIDATTDTLQSLQRGFADIDPRQVVQEARSAAEADRRAAAAERNRLRRDEKSAATDEARRDKNADVARARSLNQRIQESTRRERESLQAEKTAERTGRAEDTARAKAAKTAEDAANQRLRALMNPDMEFQPLGPDTAPATPLLDPAPSPASQAEADDMALRIREATQVPPNPDIGPTPLDDAPPVRTADEFEAPTKNPGETTPRYTKRVREERVDHIRATTDEPAWLEDPLPPGTVDSDELERIALDGTPDRIVDGKRVVGTARQARVKLREISTGLADDLSARRTAKYGMDDIRYGTGGALERGHWTNQTKLSKSMDPVLKVDKGWEDVNPLPGRRPRDVAPDVQGEAMPTTPTASPIVSDVAPESVIPTAMPPAPAGAVRPMGRGPRVRRNAAAKANHWLKPTPADEPLFAQRAKDQLADRPEDFARAQELLTPIANDIAGRAYNDLQIETVLDEALFAEVSRRVYNEAGATITSDIRWPRNPQLRTSGNAKSQRRVFEDIVHGTPEEAESAFDEIDFDGIARSGQDPNELIARAAMLRDLRFGLDNPAAERFLRREIGQHLQEPARRMPTSTKMIADAVDADAVLRTSPTILSLPPGRRPKPRMTKIPRPGGDPIPAGPGSRAPIADTPRIQGPSIEFSPARQAARSIPEDGDLLDVYVANTYITQDQADLLRETVLVGQTEVPVWSLYLKELGKTGATPQSARDAIAKRLDPKRADKNKLFRTLGAFNQWTRESILYSPFNVVRRVIQESVSDLTRMVAVGQEDAAARVLSPGYLHSVVTTARTGKHGSYSLIDSVSRWEKTGEFVPSKILSTRNRAGDIDPLDAGGTTWNRIGATVGRAVAGERGARIGAAIGGAGSSRISRDFINGLDEHKRLAVWDVGAERPMTGHLAAFRDDLRARVTKAGGDPDAILARFDELDGWAFSPQDVRRVIGDDLPKGVTDRLAGEWKNRLRTASGEGVEAADRTLFSYEYTNLDEALGRIVFFHYWQSRAIPQYTRTILQNNRLIAANLRMWNSIEAEMEAGDYPDSMRGFAAYMGSDEGFQAFVNPIAWFTPFSMMTDHIYESGDQNKLEKFLNKTGVFLNPMATGVLAAMGYMDQMPEIPVSRAMRRYAVGFYNYANANGFPLTPGDSEYVGDPIDYYIGKGMAWLTEKTAVLPNSRVIDGYDSRVGQERELATILLANYEEESGIAAYVVADDGQSRENPDFPWPEYLASQDVLDNNGTDAMATAAYQEWSEGNLKRAALMNTVPATRVRYGPVDTINQSAADGREAMDEGGQMTDQQSADTQRKQVTGAGGGEDRNLEVKQGLYQGIGTERQKALSAGHGSITNPKRGWAYEIGGQRYSGEALLAMSYDSRAALADQWVAGYNGTAELDTYRAERDAFKEANPDYVPVADHRGNVEDFDDPQYGKGPDAYRTWARTNNPNFADREAAQTRMLEDRGLSGPMLRQELDQWAMGMGGYEAYQGIRQSRSDPDPKPVDTLGGDPDAIPGTQESGGGGGFGGSGGGGGGSYDPGSEFMMDLEQYTADLAAFERTTGMPVSQMNDPRLRPYLESQGVPDLPSAVYRWQEWMATQPPGSDVSPEAYAEYLRREKESRAALELERDAQQAAVR